MSYLLNCISPLTTTVSCINTCSEKVCYLARSVKKFTVDHGSAITRGALGVTAVINLVNSIWQLYEEMKKSDPDPVKVTIPSLMIGTSARVAFETVFIDSGLARTCHNAISGWMYEIYLILWNAYLNCKPGSTAQQVLIDSMMITFGYNVTNDIIKLAKLYTENRDKYSQTKPTTHEESPESNENEIHDDPSDDLDNEIIINVAPEEAHSLLPKNARQDSKIVTELLLPNYNNLKGVIATNLILTGGGIAMLEIPIKDNSTLITFTHVAGYLIVGVGTGSLIAEAFRRAWEKVSHNTDSFLTKSLGWAIKIIQSLGIEIIAVLPYNVVDKPIFGLAGFMMGMYNTFYQRDFQNLTLEEYNEQAKENTYINSKGERCRNTALKVDIALSIFYYGLVTAFFNTGLVTSPSELERTGIGIINETIAVIIPVALLSEHSWRPGKNNWYQCIFNTFHYYLFHPLSITTIAYMACTQISEINNDALDQDNPTQRFFGYLGTSLYAIVLVGSRIQAISIKRFTKGPSSSTARMIFLKTTLDYLRRKLPTH